MVQKKLQLLVASVCSYFIRLEIFMFLLLIITIGITQEGFNHPQCEGRS